MIDILTPLCRPHTSDFSCCFVCALRVSASVHFSQFNRLLSLMANHEKLRIGVKVNAIVYSCQGRISEDKTHTGRTLSALRIRTVTVNVLTATLKNKTKKAKQRKNKKPLPSSVLLLTAIKAFPCLLCFQVGCSSDDLSRH